MFPTILRTIFGSAKSKVILLLTVTFVFFNVVLSSASAQTPYYESTGFPEFSRNVAIPLGSFNVDNGNLNIQIPLYTFNERGGKAESYRLVYNSTYWGTIDVPEQWIPYNNVGWTLVAGTLGSQMNNDSATYICPSPNYTGTYTVYSNFRFTDGNGTTRVFQSQATPGPTAGATRSSNCNPSDPALSPQPSTTAYATDGSGYVMIVTSYNQATVFSPSGDQVYPGKDTNGNALPNIPLPNLALYSALGNNTPNQPVPAPLVFYLDGGKYTIRYESVDACTDFGGSGGILAFCTGANIPNAFYQSNLIMPSSVTLPDNRQYTFTYDSGASPGHYAGLTSITLPTGGTETFGYALFSADNGISYKNRLTSVTAGTSVWTVAPAETAGGLSVDVTGPARNLGSVRDDTVYTTTVITKYSGPASANLVLATQTTTADSGRPSIVTTTVGGQTSKRQYAYTTNLYPDAAYNNQIKSISEWDFGAIGSTPTREATYIYQPGVAYANAHILDRVQIQSVYDHGGLISQTTNSYDTTGLTATSGSDATSVAGLSTHDDAHYGTGNTTRGNLTAVTEMVNATTSILTHTYYYNILGDLVESTDGNSHSTYFDYTDSWNDASCATTPLFAYPTTVTNALGYLRKTTYNSCDGTVANTQDQNDINAGRTGTSYVHDQRQRVTSETFPDGGSTTISYGGTAIPQVISTTTVATPNPSRVTATTLDGFGRVSQTTLASDPQGADIVVNTYDAVGNLVSVTNPHRSYSSPSTDGTTTYKYDALGRLAIQVQPDNTSTLQWCYNGVVTDGQTNCTANKSALAAGTWADYSDESGKHWQRVSDAFGRLISVMEPDAVTNVPSYETDYAYNALDNLIRVDQYGGAKGNATYTERVRTFTYDGLSRLWCASNPETSTTATFCPTSVGTAPTGVTTYGYDGDGNVTTRTDARTVVTGYVYDALNRVTSKTYDTSHATVAIAPTSNVGYLYDIILQGWGWTPQTSPSWPNVSQTNLVGKLSSVSVGSPGANAWTVYGYDQMGRTILKSECLPIDCGNNHHDMHYKYDAAGNMMFYDRGLDIAKNSTYPNQGYYYGGFSEQYDGAGNLSAVTGDTAGANTTTNIWSNTDYFPTGQPYTVLALGLYNLKYSVTPRGWVTGQVITNTAGTSIWNSSASYNINGTISTTTDTHAGDWTFTYDNLNRIATANSPSGNTAYSIDPFGNKHKQTTTWGMAPSSDYGAPATSNGLIGNGLLYDLGASAAGNVTYDGFHHYMYDAEGRLYSVDSTTLTPTCFTYDGDGDRVAMTNCTGHGVTTGILSEYLYDFNHRLMAQIDPTTSKIVRANVYAGNDYLAEDAPDSHLTNSPTATQLRVTDRVGTLRGLWDLSGNSTGTCTLFPYGDPNGNSCTVIPSAGIFTGKDRDAVSDLDYFGARYYSSTMGRFMSPDPMGNSVADFSNPQTWNMYSYVLNNPLSFTDPTGLDCAYLNDAGNGIESSDRNSGIGECNSNGGYWVSGMVNQVAVNDNGSYHFGYTNTDANGNISTGTYANYLGPNTDNSLSSAYNAAGNLLSDFVSGSGADVRNYDLSTVEGRNLLQSKGIQQLNAQIKAGCAAGVQAGPVNLSSGQAAANIPYDAAHSPTGGQVGGYGGGSYQNSGDSTDITITNKAGAKSFFYHAVPDRPNGSKGSARTITQNFTLSEPNPCTHP